MYIGFDTHKRIHTLVAIDEHGRQGATRTITNTPEGWVSGLAWARERWAPTAGTSKSGSLGKGLAQFLLTQGEDVVLEVSPHRTAQYRRPGRTQDKTDQASRRRSTGDDRIPVITGTWTKCTRALADGPGTSGVR